MTTIAIRKYDDKIVFASDSLITCGDTKETTSTTAKPNQKIARVDETTIAVAGDSIFFELMLEYLKEYPIDSKNPRAIRNWLKRFYSRDLPAFNFGDYTYSFAIAIEDALFEITNLYGIYAVNQFWAAGSGYKYALGALEMGATPREAVGIGIRNDTRSGGEIDEITHTWG